MRELKFGPEVYEEKVINEDAVKIAGVEPKKALVCQNEFKCGLFELLDTGISKLTEVKQDKKKHKTNKKLRKKFKEISIYKDSDQDSRVCPRGGSVLLEDSEYDLLKEHLESATPKFSARVSELLDDLWTLIDEAKEVTPKLELVEEKK